MDHLLDATRLESGLLQPVREWCDPVDIVREAVAYARLNDGAAKISIVKDLPMISVDTRLVDLARAALKEWAVGLCDIWKAHH